jgi:hypothetical protein
MQKVDTRLIIDINCHLEPENRRDPSENHVMYEMSVFDNENCVTVPVTFSILMGFMPIVQKANMRFMDPCNVYSHTKHV